MTEHSSSPDFYTAHQAAEKLGLSESRIRKLASLYGSEYQIIGSDKLFSAADIHVYIQSRNYFNRLLNGKSK